MDETAQVGSLEWAGTFSACLHTSTGVFDANGHPIGGLNTKVKQTNNLLFPTYRYVRVIRKNLGSVWIPANNRQAKKLDVDQLLGARFDDDQILGTPGLHGLL